MSALHYKEFRYFPPPRAEKRVAPGLLHFFETRGWYAQAKKNGTNCLLFLGPHEFLKTMNRHGEEISRWSPPKEMVHLLRKRLPKGWNIINGELLEHKTRTVKGTLYLHDILVLGGKHMIGTTYAKRHSILLNALVCEGAEPASWDHYDLGKNLWVARNARRDFNALFDALKAEEDEGLVLKNPHGTLGFSNRPIDWAVKCRRPTKNFGF